MSFLAFAEQRDQKCKKSSFETITAASRVARQLGTDVVALVVGDGITDTAAELGLYGAQRVIVVDQPDLKQHSGPAYAKVIAEIARAQKVDAVFLPASQMGKDIAPRLAVKLQAGLAADVTDLRLEGKEIVASRPVFAGKAIADVRITTPVKVFTLRPNVFTAVPSGTPASVEKATVALSTKDFGAVVTETRVAAGRPDVTEAEVIVSGGRGMKGPEHFKMLEGLADVLGAALGASRAVVDAGWRPHDEQVGQTGKTVAPTLYIACGISGAVQHLAGMSSSKCIVAINKDKDAPIFQIADYGIVGDVFDILPELTVQLKAALGK
jgi:electron transfer flavoprotein alpha subunit